MLILEYFYLILNTGFFDLSQTLLSSFANSSKVGCTSSTNVYCLNRKSLSIKVNQFIKMLKQSPRFCLPHYLCCVQFLTWVKKDQKPCQHDIIKI